MILRASEHLYIIKNILELKNLKMESKPNPERAASTGFTQCI